MNNKYITVTQLTKYIKYKLEQDNNLEKIYLKGEISNFKAHTRGHFYFTLKDENARISAIMFSTDTKKIKFIPEDGMKVLIECHIGVFESTGNYQIYVTEMMPDGIGNLYLAFNQLKEKLEKEGLFKKEHKKAIPKIPQKIGIITASTGAAIRDILSTLERRFPYCETILFPCLVQGEQAKNDIVKKLEIANEYNLDVIILGRGGGSIEDLWPFNEEIVARAIYKSNIPIISAVGHEIDFTISDFVADLRAPTPTGAAEMAVPNKEDVIKLLNQINIRLNKSMNNKLEFLQKKLSYLQNSYIMKKPMSLYEKLEQNFDNLYEKLINLMKFLIEKNNNRLLNIKSSYVYKNPNMLFIDKQYNFNEIKKNIVDKFNDLIDLKNEQLKKINLNMFNEIDKKVMAEQNRYVNLLSKLEVLNPITTIKRGYSITKNNNIIVKSVNDVKENDIITNDVIDGIIISKITKIEKTN